MDDNPVKVAIVGMGHAGRAHHQFCLSRPDLRLVALVDPVYRDTGSPGDTPTPVFDSLNAMWDADLDIDLLVVCTPPGVRHALVISALRHGVSCICEKPLATTAALAADLAEAARPPALLVPVHSYLHADWWRQLHARAAAAGRPRSLSVDIRRPHAAQGVSAYRQSWRTSLEIAGGGILWDIGVHALYLAQALFGCSPTTVIAPLWREQQGCEIECDVRFDFAHDRHLIFHGCWDAPARRSEWRITTFSPQPRAPSDPADVNTFLAHSPTGTGLWLHGVYDEFMTRRRDVTMPADSLDIALMSVMALEAARSSGRAGGEPRTVPAHHPAGTQATA